MQKACVDLLSVFARVLRWWHQRLEESQQAVRKGQLVDQVVTEWCESSGGEDQKGKKRHPIFIVSVILVYSIHVTSVAHPGGETVVALPEVVSQVS